MRSTYFTHNYARSYALYSAYNNENIHFIVMFVLESIMILPQVHLRKPCYDFYFL